MSLPAVALCASLLAACASAWSGSTTAGAADRGDVAAVVAGVSSVTPLTPLCRTVAGKLAEAAVSARIAARRPTSELWAAREREVAGAWEAARCPTAALVGIAYGAAEIANHDERVRYAEAGG